MGEKKKKNALRIVFHNPNSPDETANFLIKALAENISNYVINKSRTHLNGSCHDKNTVADIRKYI